MGAKPRSDAVLKTLPEDVQDRLATYLRANSLEKGVAWCATELEVETSTRALSEFREWYESTGVLTEIKRIADQFKTDLARMPNVELGDDTISQIAQQFFETVALKERNPELHMGLRKLRLREQEQQLSLKALEQKVREYEGKMKDAKSQLEAVKNRGGLTAETIKQIEEAANLL